MVENVRIELTLPKAFPENGACGLLRSDLFRSSGGRVDHDHYTGELERPAGNDPASARWHRAALPLSYGRVWWDCRESNP